MARAPQLAPLQQYLVGLWAALVAEAVVPLVGFIHAQGRVGCQIKSRRPCRGGGLVELVAEEVLLALDGIQAHIKKLRRADRELAMQGARGHQQGAPCFLGERPSDCGEALAHARLPRDDRTVL